jgi:hypothetical protein
VIIAVMENSTQEILDSIVAELTPLLPTLTADKKPGATLLAQYVRANGAAASSASSSKAAASAKTPAKKTPAKGKK